MLDGSASKKIGVTSSWLCYSIWWETHSTFNNVFQTLLRIPRTKTTLESIVSMATLSISPMISSLYPKQPTKTLMRMPRSSLLNMVATWPSSSKALLLKAFRKYQTLSESISTPSMDTSAQSTLLLWTLQLTSTLVPKQYLNLLRKLWEPSLASSTIISSLLFTKMRTPGLLLTSASHSLLSSLQALTY